MIILLLRGRAFANLRVSVRGAPDLSREGVTLNSLYGMKDIGNQHTRFRLIPRIFLALALFLGTFAFTCVSNAQSTALIADLQAATGSTSTSGTFLLSQATSAELSQATLAESGSFNASTITITTLDSDITFILNTLPTSVTTAKGHVPAPSDANFYPTLITDLFGGTGVTAIGPVPLTQSGGTYAYQIAYTISSNSRLTGILGGDTGLEDLAYFEGIAVDQNGAPTAIPQVAAANAANLASTGATLTGFQNEIGIYAEYYAAIAGKGTADDNPGIIPLVAEAIAVQPVQGGSSYTPTPAGEAAIAASVGLGALASGTYVENASLESIDLSSSAAQIAAAFAPSFYKYSGQLAEQAAIDFPAASAAISGSVTAVEPAFATYVAVDVMNGLGTSGTTYAAAITASIVRVPTLPDASRIAVAQDMLSTSPNQAAAIAGAAAASLTADSSKYTLAYLFADQLAGLETVNSITLPISDINLVPAATQAIEATLPYSDSLQGTTATTTTEYAAFPIWEAEFGYKKVAANPSYAFITGSFYAEIALAAAQAQIGGSNATPALQADDAAGVAELFSGATAILTATTVEQNALSESSTSTAAKTVGIFASNAVLGPDTPYLAAEGAEQFSSSPATVALISGSAAGAQPTLAPVTGFQVALVTSTSNYAAVTTAICNAPGSTDLELEVLCQDLIDANPSADASSHVDAIIVSIIGRKLSSDLVRTDLGFLLADEEAGVDGYFNPPPGGTVLDIPQNVADVTGAIAADETATGTQLVTDEQTLAIDAAYPLSAADTGKHGNPNPTPDEPYIPSIVNAVIGAQVSGSYLGITAEATINGSFVGAFGAELSGSVGTATIALDVPTTLSQNPQSSAPTTAYYYAFDLTASAVTYANPIATAAATGQNPYLSGSIGAAVDAASQFTKNFNTGTVAISVARTATAFTAGVQSFESDATLAQTELNDTAAYTAFGFAADSSASTALVSGTYQLYAYYDSTIAGSLASLVSGTSNRAGAGIASIFTNRLSSFAYSAAILTYVEQVAAAAATYDPAASGDIYGYVIASLESANNTNPTPYTTSSTWATNLAAVELAIKNALLASAVGLNAAEQAAVNTAYTDISAAGSNAVKAAYLAGDYGPQYDGAITFNETPVVDN